jgi:hypothetical protein
MSNHLHRATKILQKVDELASISEDEDCITRTYGTKAFIEGRNKVEQWMKAAGLQTRIDNIGNIRAGCYRGKQRPNLCYRFTLIPSSMPENLTAQWEY